MKLIGNVRLGRDSEVRFTSNSTPVATIFGAYNYGRKGDDGKRPTQWVEATLWGAKAESLEEFLKKGEQFLLTLNDVHIQTYTKNDGGNGFKLCGTVIDIDFVGGSQRREQSEQGHRPESSRSNAPAARSEPPAGGSGGSGFDDFDSDIPF